MPKTNLSDIAKALNISQATVSRSLNNHPLIKDETKEAVQEMALKLGYQSNRIASALRTGSTRMIGLAVPRLSADYAVLLNVMEEYLRKAGFHTVLVQTGDSLKSERSAIRYLLRLQIDGIVHVPMKENGNLRLLRDLRKQKIPEVFIGKHTSLPNASVLLPDWKGAGRLAAQHLYDQQCEQIAYIGQTSERAQGFLEFCESKNINVNTYETLDIFRKEKGNDQWPDGLFCESDELAYQILQLLRETKPKQEKRTAVIGCGNTPLAHAGISSIDLAYEKMGQQAVQQMLGLIAQRNQMTGSIQLIPPGLHIRQSTWRTNIGWRLKSH